ncbi:MAG: efflux RND transporter periplasmic adaptor subunit [Pseudomonadota bacterium]
MNSEYEFNINEKSEQQGFLSRVKELIWRLPRKLRIVLSIFLATVFVINLLVMFKPEAEKRPIPETVVRVDVIEAGLSSYPIVVTANGTIEAQTRGNLVAQIRGEIVSMSDNFKTGGSFTKGDTLIEIDPRDYQAALSQAMATLSQADAAYRQEQANARQAEQDWKRLGNDTPAPDLVRRKPQLAASRAQLDSAKANHETAQLNLSRTKITAPYSGRIIRRDAVLGQYVGVGTPIAEVFSTDGVEVRLPISQDEYTQLGLDSFDPNNAESNLFDVQLNSTVGGRDYQWQAKITRTDSTFDINTRQIDVIAEVADPFGTANGQPPLKIGQFVSAQITGRTVDNVYVIPNKSIREGTYTYVARDGRLVKQDIDIIWQDDQNTLIASGIAENELVVTTSLNSTLAGAKVKLPEDFVARGSISDAPIATDSASVEESSEGAETVSDEEVDSQADEAATATESAEVETDSGDNPDLESEAQPGSEYQAESQGQSNAAIQ